MAKAKTPGDVLKATLNVKVNGSLWLESENGHFFGPGLVELLDLIEKTGSINSAAKEMKMSYKKAWELINRLNEQTSFPIVSVKTGGERGGGSTLTTEALTLIKYYRELRERFAAFLGNETQILKE